MIYLNDGDPDWEDLHRFLSEKDNHHDWDLSKTMEAEINKNHEHFRRSYTMEIVITLTCLIGLIVVLCLLCSCCRRNRNRGRVLSPPPAADTRTPAAYPQQQYTIAAYPVAHTVTHTGTAYPTAAPYPAAPYPTNTGGYPMPGVSPHVTGGAPYPTGGAHYPTGGTPYPTGGAPYPTGGAPYPTGPTAPDANALPPTYDQAVGGIEKQPPYNPTAPR